MTFQSVSGVVYWDRDGNGSRATDGSEPGLSGFSLHIENTSPTGHTATAVSGSGGTYTLHPDMPDNDYCCGFVVVSYDQSYAGSPFFGGTVTFTGADLGIRGPDSNTPPTPPTPPRDPTFTGAPDLGNTFWNNATCPAPTDGSGGTNGSMGGYPGSSDPTGVLGGGGGSKSGEYLSGGSTGGGGSSGGGDQQVMQRPIPRPPTVDARYQLYAGKGSVAVHHPIAYPNTSSGPVRYGDGLAQEESADLPSTSVIPWGHTRSWTNSDDYAGAALNGNGWTVVQWPALKQSDIDASIAQVLDGNDVQWFNPGTPVGTDVPYTGRHASDSTMMQSYGNDEFVLTNPDGSQYRYYNFAQTLPVNQRGAFKSYTDAAGNTVTAQPYDSSGRLTEVRIAVAGTSTVESYYYEYYTSGASDGRLLRASYRISTDSGSTFTTVRQAEYTYYNGTDTDGNAYGRVGDLKTATVKDASDNVLDTTYYRYYTTDGTQSDGSTGYAGGMRMALYGQDYARATTALGDPLTATDADLKGYASRYYEYDTNHRVSKETVSAAGCSTCAGGFGTYSFSYTTSSNTDGTNSWKYKTIETLPDGNQNIVYMNYLQQIMLKVYKETSSGSEWCTYTRYDSDGRPVLIAQPSAVTGYDDTKADLLNNVSGNYQYLADHAGLIETYMYGTTSSGGEAVGYLKTDSLQNGELDSAPDTQESLTYVGHTDANSITVYMIASDTVYRSDDGGDPQTTSYSYTWVTGTNQLESVTATLPIVTTAQNGPATATTVSAYFDVYGRVTWAKDADGFILNVEYDPATGAVTKLIQDVDTTAVSNEPTGWVTPTGGGLHLTTQFQVDALGRTTKVTDPKGNVTYVVFNDASHEVRTYAGWTQTGSNWGPTGPVLVSRDDRAGSYNETLTFAYTPTATSTPTGAESISASNIQSLTRKYQNSAGQLDHTDRFVTLAGYATGTNVAALGTDYLRTSYAYQSRGKLKRVTAPDGTIEWTVYDGLNRLVSMWTGTNDTGFTNSDPSGGTAGASAGNNMVEVAEYVYDNGSVGDSNLTQSRTVFGSGGSDYYATDYKYDGRDRLTDSRGADNVATHYTLDNLGQATEVDTYADLDADLILDTVPGANGTELRARTDYAFDEQGRVYQTKMYNVDLGPGSNTGSITPGSGQRGHILTTNTWYNARGMGVKVSQPNGLFQKMQYDGAARTVASFTGYDTDDTEGGSAYAGAQTVTGDTVIAQVKTIYDKAGNVVTNTSYERLESDTTSTGTLGAATNQAFVQTTVNWYDFANRLIGTANYGRDNGSTRYVFNTSGALIDANSNGLPDEAEGTPRSPNTTDDYIAAKYEYDSAGRPFKTTDNLGHTDWTFYDLLGRKTKLVENVPGTNTAQVETDTDQRRTTEFLYDAQGRLSKQRAWNPKGSGNGIELQDTTYFYRSPMDASSVTETVYPDSGNQRSVTSITRSGSTATVTAAGHGYANGDTVLIAGADQPAYNGYFVISNVTTNTFDITVTGTPDNSSNAGITAVSADRSDLVRSAYDRLGRTTSTTDQRGTVHAYEFDSAGRFLADDVATLGSGVDGAVRRVDYGYDDLSRVQTVTSRSGTTAASMAVNQVAYTYDGWGDVIKTQQAHGGTAGASTPAVQYTFDDGLPSGSTNTAALFLRQTQVTYPATNRTVFYNYGASNVAGTSANSWYLNRVDNVADSAAGTNTYAHYTYVGADRLVRVDHPAISGTNDLTLSYSLGTAGQYQGLDRFGRVVQQLWKDTNLTGGNFDGYQYTYDRNGNVLTKDYFASGNTGKFDEQFTYDGLDRLAGYKRGTLASGSITGTNITFQQDWTGGLDAQGNWASYNNNGTTQTRTADKANETTGIAGQTWIAPSYDAAGNMTSGPKAGAETTRLWYVYDAWNRLVQVKNDSAGSPGTVLATYTYDGLNRRLSKATGGNTDDFYYNEGWQLLEVRRNGSSNAREQYTWDAGYIDTPIFRVQDTDSNGTVDNTIYYLTDTNHNVTSVYDASTNNIQERYVYDPYGKVTIYDRLWSSTPRSSSAFGNNVLFAGYYADTETGNYYVRNRYYQPTLGRWISRDPIKYGDGSDLYEYTGSAPVSNTDPSGALTLRFRVYWSMFTAGADPDELTKMRATIWREAARYQNALDRALTWCDKNCTGIGLIRTRMEIEDQPLWVQDLRKGEIDNEGFAKTNFWDAPLSKAWNPIPVLISVIYSGHGRTHHGKVAVGTDSWETALAHEFGHAGGYQPAPGHPADAQGHILDDPDNIMCPSGEPKQADCQMCSAIKKVAEQTE